MTEAKPFVKWAGGKRQLLPQLKKRLPNHFSSYYEPFVGGGALLFELEPKKAIINDANKSLINVYQVIKDNVEELIDELKKHKNEEDYYYKVRKWDRQDGFDNMSNIKKAARILYLNKTCYNGLYRVNSKGQFNVPFGRYKNPDFVNEETLREVHRYLNNNNIRILNVDFEQAVKHIREPAFVYFDPPYHPISDTSSFTGYTKDGFKAEDQKRLKKLCDNLDERGINFLLSNSSADLIRRLYEGKYTVEYLDANRCINSNPDKRGSIEEMLVRNY